MSNLENLNNHETPEYEKIIGESTNEISDLKDELPVTKEEANEICTAFDDYLTEFQKTKNPSEALNKSLNKGINDAESAGVLKLSKEEYQKANGITEKIISAGFHTNLLIRGNEIGEIYISPNGLIEAINDLDKQDRKLIKKILKAMVKMHEKEAKRDKKNKKSSINKIN